MNDHETRFSPAAVNWLKGRIDFLKRLSDQGQHPHIPGLSAGACYEFALELERFFATIIEDN